MSILDSVLAALGGGTLGVIATAAAKRGASRDASAARVVEPLLRRIDTLEQRMDREREEHEAQRKADQAACLESTAIAVGIAVETHTAPLRATIAAMVEREAAQRESQHGEDTGVHMLRAQAAEVRRTPTPPEGVPAQPGPKPELMVRREIPPPKRGKGD